MCSATLRSSRCRKRASRAESSSMPLACHYASCGEERPSTVGARSERPCSSTGMMTDARRMGVLQIVGDDVDSLTSDGRVVHIRALGPADLTAVQDLHSQASD